MVGVEIVRQAAFAPAAAIANNCGKQGAMIAEKIAEREGSWGYNGLHDEFCDMVKAGVMRSCSCHQKRSQKCCISIRSAHNDCSYDHRQANT
jgi:chaperonin GroEL (HSP60 family)